MAQQFDVKSISGLSKREAAERLARDGFNELPSSRRRSVFAIAFEVAREPMFLLLVGCGTLYLLLGDLKEASMLLAFVFMVMGTTIYQEHKTENALGALRDLSSPRALVIRDGEQMRIPGREVVCGDIVVLAEGDRIPADAVLVWAVNLSVDESLLTGESVPVRKSPIDPAAHTPPDSIEMERPGGDDTPFLYSGTLVVTGQGICAVRNTGIRTEIGRIGKALQEVEPEETALSRETGRLIRTIALFGLALFAVIVIVYGITRSDWIHGLLAGITLAMAVLPEEFPVIITIFLALGAWRMSQKNVLTRRMPAIETLGAATVLCVDKTGTITQNRMSVARLFCEGREYYAHSHEDASSHAASSPVVSPGLPEVFHQLIEFAILASEKDPFDPMEKALTSFGQEHLLETEHLHADWTLVEEYSLSKELLALSHVWLAPDKTDELAGGPTEPPAPTGPTAGHGRYIVAAKGAPEAIADLCHMDEEHVRAVLNEVANMAEDGLRVLGVARATAPAVANQLPETQHDFGFEFIGLVGLADPVKPQVASAVRECYQAGIRVVMITGDYPGTACNVARQIGLTPSDKVITGPELARMGDDDLRERLKTCCIFARVVPEQKLRLVEALKANGEVVAMTGDGVNDAPALKAADIGIAMGGRGTDVAREAASLVLLDDNFTSIVAAVRHGRRIYDNLRKAIVFTFAVHMPIVGLSLFPVLLKWPLVLLPVHIAFLELIIDPACSVVFEMEEGEADLMARPPRDQSRPIFGSDLIRLGVVQGLSILAFVLALFVAAMFVFNRGEAEARSLTFTTLVLADLGLIAVNRSWKLPVFAAWRRPNPAMIWVVGGSLVFLALALSLPTLRFLFHFTVLHPADIGMCVGIGVLSILWLELFKTHRHADPL